MAEWGGANESLKDDRDRGLYGKYAVSRVDGKDKGPYFVLAYTTDPHARVALEAYADSCEGEFPALAADLYRALGVEIGTAQADIISAPFSQYLGKHYPGRWVAIRNGRVVAAGDSLKEARGRSEGPDARTLLYVPKAGTEVDW